MWVPRCCVYVLRSSADPGRYYTGVTSDWRAGLEAHNAGRCLHIASGRPWKIDVIVQFADEKRAVAFERYLKSGRAALLPDATYPDASEACLPRRRIVSTDTQRRKARSGESGCALCCGVVTGTRPASTDCAR
jgi:predicted GIY-YIG superfamily endonuclease